VYNALTFTGCHSIHLLSNHFNSTQKSGSLPAAQGLRN
jgi:hypothetical protein